MEEEEKEQSAAERELLKNTLWEIFINRTAHQLAQIVSDSGLATYTYEEYRVELQSLVREGKLVVEEVEEEKYALVPSPSWLKEHDE